MTYETDEVTMMGIRQDWAVVCDFDADALQRRISMQRIAHVDMATQLRLVTPFIEQQLDELDPVTADWAIALMADVFVRTMQDLALALARSDRG